MTDFFSSLIERHIGSTPAIRPRVAFLFEPVVAHRDTAVTLGDISTGGPLFRSGHSTGVAPEVRRPRQGWNRRDEQADDSGAGQPLEPEGRTISESTPLPDRRPPVAELQLSPEPIPRELRPPVEQQSDLSRRARWLLLEMRQREGVPVTQREQISAAAPSTNGLRPGQAGIAAPPEAAGYEERGLLVPTKLGASVAADLQRTVSWATASRDRGPGWHRAAEGPHALTERDVHVTIGRIEVRATVGEKSPVRKRPASPVMGLNEYLRHHAQRGGQ